MMSESDSLLTLSERGDCCAYREGSLFETVRYNHFYARTFDEALLVGKRLESPLSGICVASCSTSLLPILYPTIWSLSHT